MNTSVNDIVLYENGFVKQCNHFFYGGFEGEIGYITE